MTDIVTPIDLHYTHTASFEETYYLRGLMEGKIIGGRTDANGKVYVPPRGANPTDGMPTKEQVEVSDKGTITTFCIVNVPFLGQQIKPPYVAAYVLLDGADIPFLHLILDVDAAEVRMGMRVEAVWAAKEEWEYSLRNVSHFRPSGEPDADYDSYSTISRSLENMTDIAVVGFAQAPHVRETTGTTNGVEMLVPCFQELYSDLGITKSDIGFWCSGSSDYLAGRSFSFISAIDSIGAVPPINESHVEMDAAWALYEAWVKLMTGEVDTALVYGFGKSSAGNLRQILAMQMDPYLVSPLWPDSVSVAGLQARLGLESGKWTAEEMAAIAQRSRAAAKSNPDAQISGDVGIETLLASEYVAAPLRAHDCAPITDGAAAIILARGDRARELCERPAWITGIEHRIDSPNIGSRDLTTSPSTASAARAATGGDVSNIDVAELHAPFTHQEIILREAIGLTDTTTINPSGGPLTGNPMFSGGLERIGYAARSIMSGDAQRVLAHATSGPVLQQNLVAVMEGRN